MPLSMQYRYQTEFFRNLFSRADFVVFQGEQMLPP
jgi:hypothetical protein